MAPTVNQITGAILEEVVLYVLGAAGFHPLENLKGDPTIDPNGPPVTIRGRGTMHQIDAVADPAVGYAFSNPFRLLVEAKAYSGHRRVGLAVVRNAVGTAKDVSEFWRPSNRGTAGSKRYHYRYAIFATTEFTKGAQEYAFAQDVYLLPLRRSAFIRPVITAIEKIRSYYDRTPGTGGPEVVLADYRRAVREALRTGQVPEGLEELDDLVRAVQRVRHGLVAVADRQFPIFLVPRTPQVVEGLDAIETVRIFRDDEGWYMRRKNSNEDLFSFDLPDELIELYTTGRGLDPHQALDLKAERLAVLQAIVVLRNSVRLVQFKLDEDWINALRGRRQG